mgnify:CR=1 FL=1
MGYPKGYTLACMAFNRKTADKKAAALRRKFYSVIVRKGTRGAAWDKKQTVYRVWVR